MKLYYLGPAGSGLGFELSGMTVVNCADGADLLKQLVEVQRSEGGIAFVDEGLAEKVLSEVEEINRDNKITVVLLANGAKPKRLAAKKMDHLMVQAVGSDIFNT